MDDIVGRLMAALALAGLCAVALFGGWRLLLALAGQPESRPAAFAHAAVDILLMLGVISAAILIALGLVWLAP